MVMLSGTSIFDVVWNTTFAVLHFMEVKIPVDPVSKAVLIACPPTLTVKDDDALLANALRWSTESIYCPSGRSLIVWLRVVAPVLHPMRR